MLNKYRCVKCGYEWTPRIPNPPTCPKCRSIKWKDLKAITEQNVSELNVLEGRVIITMLVKPETKDKLNRLKEYNSEISWDLILEPIISQVLLPKPQSRSVNPPPIIKMDVNYSPDTINN